MTRLVTCGWETGDVAEVGGTSSTSNGAVTVATATPTPASGNDCLKCAFTATIGTSYAVRSVSLGGSRTDVWLRVRFYNGLTGADSGFANAHRVLRLVDSGGTMVAMLLFDATTGILRAYRGGAALGNSTPTTGATLLGSASVAISAATWTLVEVHYVPATGATGAFEVWINGAQTLDVTATQTSTGLANVQSVTIGVERNTTASGSASSFVGYDDLGANDTAGSLNAGRCGDYRIAYLPADGAGASTQWTPSAGANYQCVDDTGDLSAGTADYVSTNTTAQVDDYTVANLPAGATTVPVVVALAYATNPAAGATQVKVGLISGATTSAGTAQTPPGVGYAYLREQFETDPATSAAWTATAVNAAKVRLESA